MIVPDTNLLIYAYNGGTPHYHAARLWWEGLVNGPERVGIPWIVVLGFVRLITNPRIIESPMSPLETVSIFTTLFLQRCATIQA